MEIHGGASSRALEGGLAGVVKSFRSKLYKEWLSAETELLVVVLRSGLSRTTNKGARVDKPTGQCGCR